MRQRQRQRQRQVSEGMQTSTSSTQHGENLVLYFCRMCRNHHRLDSIKNALTIRTQSSLYRIVFCLLRKDTCGPCMYNCAHTNTRTRYMLHKCTIACLDACVHTYIHTDARTHLTIEIYEVNHRLIPKKRAE